MRSSTCAASVALPSPSWAEAMPAASVRAFASGARSVAIAQVDTSIGSTASEAMNTRLEAVDGIMIVSPVGSMFPMV